MDYKGCAPVCDVVAFLSFFWRVFAEKGVLLTT
jgi:hypothetical protein